jgi:hypothetical protein
MSEVQTETTDDGLKQKKLQQLQAARLKKQTLKEEREKRIRDLEEKLDRVSSVAVPERKVEPETKVYLAPSETSEAEVEERPVKRAKIVTRRTEVLEDSEGPNYVNEIVKNVLLGSLSIAGLYIAHKFGSSTHTKPLADPKPKGSELSVGVELRPHTGKPVGKSGFFH